MEPTQGEEADGGQESLGKRLRDLEAQVQLQAREIRGLEKIEELQDQTGALETENRALRERIAELHTFLTLSKTLSTSLNLEELFRRALHLIGRALPGDAYALLLLDEAGERLVVKAAVGLPAEAALGTSLRRGEGIAGLVAQTGQALLVPDVSAAPRAPGPALQPPQGAVLCVPLQRPGRELLGVLHAQTPERAGFSLPDLDRFQAVAHQVASALENAQLYQRTQELATRDDLTGLFNRRHFFDQLEKEVQRARRYRRVFTLCLLDLDDFKGYNDAHGHLQGDAALQVVARLLLASTRRADLVARFGGEEFVVLLPEVPAPGAAVVAEKIRSAVASYPFARRLTATLGLASYPADAEDGLALVDLADRALYLGKQQGGDRICVAPGQSPPEPPVP
jgi:diguanylate cyclase (GGDEF)-like protein